MNIYYVRALFRMGGAEQSKAGYVLADTILEATYFACDKIRTYGLAVDIQHIEADLRKDELQVTESAKAQPPDHWDKLYSFKSDKNR